MPTTTRPRIHWAWWMLAFALLLAWHYLPQPASPRMQPSVASNPAGSAAATRAPVQVDASTPSASQSLPDTRLRAFLPSEARDTIALIQRGGPFPNRQDGGVFGNREGHLPRKPRDWYHEYTVDTPGLSHRGTRRIITGGNPPQDWYYTSDHYDSFRAFDPGADNGVGR